MRWPSIITRQYRIGRKFSKFDVVFHKAPLLCPSSPCSVAVSNDLCNDSVATILGLREESGLSPAKEWGDFRVAIAQPSLSYAEVRLGLAGCIRRNVRLFCGIFPLLRHGLVFYL